MIPFPIRGMAAAFLTVAALSACASTGQGSLEPAPAPVGSDANAAAIARARADSMRHPYTEADVHFMTSMIGHHAQAVTMARLAPTRAESPAVKTLAERIINGQQDEIRTMQQWLRDRLKPVPEPDLGSGTMDHGAMHGDSTGRNAMQHDSTHHAGTQHDSTHHSAMHGGTGHGSAHAESGHSMPGMLSPAQMSRLRSARGAEFDRLFLTYMIQHHRGAVSMVEELFGTYGAAQDETVFKFASDVNVDQITEIARMERMLRSLLFEAPGQ